MASQKLLITQTRSVIGTQAKHKACLRSLGLKKIGSSVEVEDNSQNRGYLLDIKHLVKIEVKK